VDLMEAGGFGGSGGIVYLLIWLVVHSSSCGFDGSGWIWGERGNC